MASGSDVARRAAPPQRRKRVVAGIGLVLLVYLVFGLWIRGRAAPRPALPPGEIHGSYHVHTRWSDGRGTLDQVVAAAKGAGLQFLVVTDHNVLRPEDAGYRDGILVIEATEASSSLGHIVALGVSRALTPEEREQGTFEAIRALGGQPIVAHPFQPRRPFLGWSRQDWDGFEVVSADTHWGSTLAHHRYWLLGLAALAYPWDPAQSALAFADYPEKELERYDLAARTGAPEEPPRPAHPLFCSNDAHGWPSYRATFEAFSMHLPLTLTGNAAQDSKAVLDRLLDGSAYCVFDGVAPAQGVKLALTPQGDALELNVGTPEPGRGRYVLVRDGVREGDFQTTATGGRFACRGPCVRRAFYRVEGFWEGRPWIFTNPVWIE